MDVEHVVIGGLDVVVDAVGVGPPLMVLHGILQDSRAWGPQVASALILVGAYAGWAGSLPSQVQGERLASCLAQSTMAPEDFVPDWMSGVVHPSRAVRAR
jgi:pimeloyl-ACP methyl ester carboxylesterase